MAYNQARPLEALAQIRVVAADAAIAGVNNAVAALSKSFVRERSAELADCATGCFST